MPRFPSGPQAATLLVATVALAAAVGCGRSRPSTASAPLQAPAPAAARIADAGPSPAPGAGNVTSQPSEFVATNVAPPGCRDCKQGDAAAGPTYYGKPEITLDDKTLADVKETVDATCLLLEEGVAILEKHAKAPDEAAAALDAYRKEKAAHIQRVFERAKEVKARLKAVGYDQDIPVEVRPHFDERMSKIQTRLEAMRDTYRKHPDVLESFGALFPRGP